MGMEMSYYFTNDGNLESELEQFHYSFHGIEFEFISDNGMFSKGHVDYASDILIRNLPEISGTLLDLGCGYGAIGITLGKVYGLDVTMVDVNKNALNCARENCRLNQVEADVIESYCFENIKGKFDNIIINPPIHAGKEVIFEMYEGSLEALNEGGSLYIIIQKKHGAESTIKKLNEVFDNCETLYKKKGFYILCSTK